MINLSKEQSQCIGFARECIPAVRGYSFIHSHPFWVCGLHDESINYSILHARRSFCLLPLLVSKWTIAFVKKGEEFEGHVISKASPGTDSLSSSGIPNHASFPEPLRNVSEADSKYAVVALWRD